MNDVQTRRAFLRAAAAASAAWAAADLSQVEEALAWAAHQTGQGRRGFTVLTAGQADGVDALTSRILPSADGRPGAREAGVVYFIDKALATFNAAQKKLYVDGVDDLNRRAARKWKGTAGFAALTPGAAGRAVARHREDAVLPGRALRHDRRDLRAADVGRQSRLRRLAHARPRAPAAFQAPFGYYDADVNRRSDVEQAHGRRHVSRPATPSTSSSSVPAPPAASSRKSCRRPGFRSSCSSRALG